MAKAAQETVAVTVPKVTLAKARKVLEARGTNLDDWLRLQLRSLIRHNRFYSLGDRYAFGKYKDERVEDVIRADPEYVAWCLREVAGFALDPAALELLSEMGIEL